MRAVEVVCYECQLILSKLILHHLRYLLDSKALARLTR